MKESLKGLVEKTITSFIPWLFITVLVFYFVFESAIIATFSGILTIVFMFAAKRWLIKNKQKRAIVGLVEQSQIVKDDISISFKDDEDWRTGIMELNGVKFYCMTSCSDGVLTLKLPTLYGRKSITIKTQDIELLDSPVNDGNALIKLRKNGDMLSLPWKSNFDKHLSKGL